MSGPLLLSIESSCDETGIALIAGGRHIVSNVVASQVALHAPSGGIVQEVAARAHLRWIVPSLDEAWAGAGVSWEEDLRIAGEADVTGATAFSPPVCALEQEVVVAWYARPP